MFDNISFWVAVFLLYLSSQVLSCSRHQITLISFISPFLFYFFFGIKFVFLSILTVFIIFFLSNGLNIFFFKLNKKYSLLLFLILILVFSKNFDFHIVGLSYFIIRFYDYIHFDKSHFLEANLKIKIYNHIHLYSYLFPLHAILAGPLLQYSKFVNYKNRKMSFLRFQKSIYIILVGLIFKYILGYYFSILIENFINNSLLKSSLALLYVFFDFAGYSLMAIGVGFLIGYELPANFNNPFFSKSLGEFFERWHISLSLMAKKHIFNPFQLFLIRSGYFTNIKLISSLSITTTFLAIAMWHQLSINFFLWGLFLGIALSVEQLFSFRQKIDFYFNGNSFKNFYSILLFMYTFIFISFSYYLLADELYNMIS